MYICTYTYLCPIPGLGELERVLLGLDGHLHLPDVVLLLLNLLLRLV